jgi:hypothetical protein
MYHRKNGSDKWKFYSIRNEAKINFGGMFAIVQFKMLSPCLVST